VLDKDYRVGYLVCNPPFENLFLKVPDLLVILDKAQVVHVNDPCLAPSGRSFCLQRSSPLRSSLRLVLDMDRLPQSVLRSFHERFRKRRVWMNSEPNVFKRRPHLDSERRLAYQIGRLGTHDAYAYYNAGAFVRDNLGEPLAFGRSKSSSICAERKPAH